MCGIRRIEDALSAAALGVDAVGFMFYKKSPRYIAPWEAVKITNVLPPFISKVGVFVNASAAEVESTLNIVHMDILQLHGEESPELCRSYNRPYIKAVRVRDRVDINALITRYADAIALLLDSFVEESRGGTGQQFDWSKISTDFNEKIILAGGLTAGNVAHAIDMVAPVAVDVSSSVENQPGVKDAEKMARFMREVMHAGQYATG